MLRIVPTACGQAADSCNERFALRLRVRCSENAHRPRFSRMATFAIDSRSDPTSSRCQISRTRSKALLDSICEHGIVFPTDERFASRPKSRSTIMQCRLKLPLEAPAAETNVPGWWSQTGSNRRPPACKAGALPTELWPRRRTDDRQRRTGKARFRHLSSVFRRPILVGLGRLELPTSRLSSARSNQLSYKPGSEVRLRMTEDRRVICHPSSDL